mmetsp:Transcript_733/g.1760  ORF Transcript_733/g.1760 Transcript_733/m.1760 type:complete len:424 (+) Transcript_733:332-1603(+)
MPQQDPRMRIDIGIRIGHLPVLGENSGHDLINGVDDFEERIVRHVFQSEFPLAGVPRVGFAQHGVSVSGNDLFGVQGLPGKFRDGLGVDLLALGLEFGLQGLDPLEDFLVGQAVERSGKGVQAGGVGEVGVGEGGSDEVGGVGAGVAALVIGVDAEVEAHELVEGGVVVAEHAAEVPGVVEGGVLLDDPVEVDVAVDGGGDFGDDGEDVEDVLEGVFVVVRFGDAVGVGFGEARLGLGRVESDGELGHGVHVFGEGVEQGHDVVGQLGAGVEFGGEGVDLLFGGDFAGQEEPDETFEEGLAVAGFAGEGGQHLLAFRDGEAAEPDALVGVQVGGFPEHAFHAAGSADELVDGHFADDLGAVFLFEGGESGLFVRDLGLERFLEGGHGTGRGGVDGRAASGRGGLAEEDGFGGGCEGVHVGKII